MLTQQGPGPGGWATALILAIVGVMGACGYDSDRCYCAEDMDNDLWANRNSYVDVNKPSEYLGVLVNGTGHYINCTCTDVLRCKSPLRVSEASVVANYDTEAQDQVLKALMDLMPYLEAWSPLEHRMHHFTVELETSNLNSKVFTVEAFLLGEDVALVSKLQVAISNLTEDGLPQVGAIGGFNFTESNDFYLEDNNILDSHTTTSNNMVKRESDVRMVEEIDEVTTRDPYKPPPTNPPQQLNLEARHAPLPTSECSYPPQEPDRSKYKIESDAVYYLCDKGFSWDAVSLNDWLCNSGDNRFGWKPCVHCTVDGWEPVSIMDELSCTRDITKKVVGSFDWMYPNAYIVTAPAFFGLVLLIIFCICCTRMNSPLYHICRDKSQDGLLKA